MEAFHIIGGDAEFNVFSSIPPRFFRSSLSRPPHIFGLETDVGLIQRDPFNEDIPGTLKALESFYPLKKQQIEHTASKLLESGCAAVVCDISPLGIAAAADAGIPSVLVENFTWDWLYRSYLSEEPRLRSHIEYLEKIFSMARYRIKTSPLCCRGSADLITSCVSRMPGRARNETRGMLDIGERSLLILVTVGGMEGEIRIPMESHRLRDTFLLFPADKGSQRRAGNCIFVSKDTDLFYPDLIAASDLIIGKIGYSTLAEAYNSGIPYGYVIRSRFPESWILASFMEGHGRGAEVPEESLMNGSWISDIEKLVSIGRKPPRANNGAFEIARFLLSILDR